MVINVPFPLLHFSGEQCFILFFWTFICSPSSQFSLPCAGQRFFFPPFIWFFCCCFGQRASANSASTNHFVSRNSFVSVQGPYVRRETRSAGRVPVESLVLVVREHNLLNPVIGSCRPDYYVVCSRGK